MKLKEISKLCKATGRVIMSDVRGMQWIGNRYASFPMLGMPELDEETVFTCLDYDEKTIEKMEVRRSTHLSLENYVSSYPKARKKSCAKGRRCITVSANMRRGTSREKR